MKKKPALRKRLSLSSGIPVTLIDGPPTSSSSSDSFPSQKPQLPKVQESIISLRSFGATKAGKTPYVEVKTNQDSYLIFSSKTDLNEETTLSKGRKKSQSDTNGCVSISFNNSQNEKTQTENSENEKQIDFELFAVFDGHGMDGHKVSSFLKRKLGSQFAKNLSSHFSKQSSQKSENLSNETKEQKPYGKKELEIIKVIQKTIEELDSLLKKQPFDTERSGSTLIACFFISGFLYTANVGDSRAVLLLNSFPPFSPPNNSNPSKNLSETEKLGKQEDPLIELSFDQKPDLERERQRILAAGGRVAKSVEFNTEDDPEWDDAPSRVWLGGEDIPGLAMSRAMGDFLVKTVGVICTPEIRIHKFDKKESGKIILASDGVWEFVGSREAFEILGEGKVEQKMVEKVVEESANKWRKYGYGMVVDDITMIVLEYEVEE